MVFINQSTDSGLSYTYSLVLIQKITAVTMCTTCFNIRKLYILTSQCVCFRMISQSTAVVFLHVIKRSVFVWDVLRCLWYSVRVLNIYYVNFSFQTSSFCVRTVSLAVKGDWLPTCCEALRTVVAVCCYKHVMEHCAQSLQFVVTDMWWSSAHSSSLLLPTCDGALRTIAVCFYRHVMEHCAQSSLLLPTCDGAVRTIAVCCYRHVMEHCAQ